MLKSVNLTWGIFHLWFFGVWLDLKSVICNLLGYYKFRRNVANRNFLEFQQFYYCYLSCMYLNRFRKVQLILNPSPEHSSFNDYIVTIKIQPRCFSIEFVTVSITVSGEWCAFWIDKFSYWWQTFTDSCWWQQTMWLFGMSTTN